MECCLSRDSLRSGDSTAEWSVRPHPLAMIRCQYRAIHCQLLSQLSATDTETSESQRERATCAPRGASGLGSGDLVLTSSPRPSLAPSSPLHQRHYWRTTTIITRIQFNITGLHLFHGNRAGLVFRSLSNMLSKLLALAATTSAFLVLPEMLDDKKIDEGIFKALPIATSADNASPLDLLMAESSGLDVPCAKCEGGADSSLHFDFKVQDNSKLMLNDFEVFPNPDPLAHELRATVSGGDEEVLGYSILTQWIGADNKQGIDMMELKVQVAEVGKKLVDGVPSVKVTFLVSPTQSIHIVDAVLADPVVIEQPKCAGPFCALQGFFDEIFKGRIGRIGRMGCHKGHKGLKGLKDVAKSAYGHGVPAPHGWKPKHPAHSHGPPHGHPDFSDHHGHKHYGKLLRNLMSHIFLPVILGITAGAGAAV